MSSFFGSLLGDDQAGAARDAARDTYQKQQVATGQIKQYGDEYAKKFEDMSHGYDPYVATGAAGNSALMRLLQDPSSVRSLPAYDFAQGEGVKALDRGAAAHGMLNSGRGSKDLLRFGTGLADKTYGDQLARLMGISNGGMAATGAQIGAVGQGLNGQMQTRQSAYAGDMNSAGTIGQGDIAAATARGKGVQNIMDFTGKLAGSAFGSFGGGGAFGSGASSYGGVPGAGSSPSMGGAGTGFDSYGRQFSFG
jgi:hypothetical protein